MDIPMLDADAAAPQSLEAADANGDETTFPVQSGLSNQEEQEVASTEGAVGTFGSIFEIHFPPQAGISTRMARTLAAVLSDHLGRDCLKMVVTTTTQAALNLRSRTDLPRFFVLADNPSRPELLRQLPLKYDGVWPAWQLLQVRQEVGHQRPGLETDLRDKCLPKYCGNLLIARDEQVALAFKSALARLNRECPSIVCLDGFTVSGQGHFGGRSAARATSLEAMAQRPYFGFGRSRSAASSSAPALDALGDAFDKEEREERELAARRAVFAAGAAEEDEQLDWSAAAAGGGSDDEADAFVPAGDEAYDHAAAARLLDVVGSAVAGAPAKGEASRTWLDEEGYVPPGREGFNEFAREQMRRAGVPSNECVLPSSELAPATWAGQPTAPKLQPYQETVSYLCRPQSLLNPRMLVVHRTGCGKTATMIQIADNYYLDRRPKILIFPTNAVCNSFYRELRNPAFPNRYADYLQSGGFQDSKKALELTGILRNGVVLDEFVNHPDLPSAPLRAFSYTMAGGASSCGQRPNAVFKCPDGYAGSYPDKVPPIGGYDDFDCGYNPFSNKIVLMDEVHNLVRPSMDILRNERRMLMLQRLRQLLRTAENSVVIGFTGTPLSDVPAESSALLNLIKGRNHHALNDEGFVSYYMDTPSSVFPRVAPLGVLSQLPPTALRRVPMRNLPPPAPAAGGAKRRGVPAAPAGNRHEYDAKLDSELSKLELDGEGDDAAASVESLDPIKLSIVSRLCSIAQTAGYAGREDVARVVYGAPGNLLKKPQKEAPYGSDDQVRRARGYASKLHQICEDIAAARPPLKTLVIIHRNAGYKLLLRMLARRLGEDNVRGFPPARTQAERKDTQLLPLLGFAHDESRGRSGCPCALCVFNRSDAPTHASAAASAAASVDIADGPPRADGLHNLAASSARRPYVMVADAKECGEGVSFFGVRRLILADVPSTSEDLLQRVGRAVRFMGHSALPLEQRQVEVRLYVATHKHGTTADEVMVERLREDLQVYAPELAVLKSKAVDAGMWVEEAAGDEGEEMELAATEEELAGLMDELALSESEDEPAPPEPQQAAHEPAVVKPEPKPRKRAPAKAKAPVVKAASPGEDPPAPPEEDKENGEQALRGSPHASPGRPLPSTAGLHASPGRSPVSAASASAASRLDAALATKMRATGAPTKGIAASESSVAPATAAPAAAPAAKRTPTRRTPAAAKKFVKAAKRSEDEDSGSDMDGWMARSDESDDDDAGSGSSDSNSFRSSELSDGSESAGETSGNTSESEEEDGSADGQGTEETTDAKANAKATAEPTMNPAAASPLAPPRPPPPKPLAPSDDEDIFCSPPADPAPTAAERKRLIKGTEARG